MCVFPSKNLGKYSINFVLNDCLNYAAAISPTRMNVHLEILILILGSFKLFDLLLIFTANWENLRIFLRKT